jgi:hypothetical protein
VVVHAEAVVHLDVLDRPASEERRLWALHPPRQWKYSTARDERGCPSYLITGDLVQRADLVVVTPQAPARAGGPV